MQLSHNLRLLWFRPSFPLPTSNTRGHRHRIYQRRHTRTTLFCGANALIVPCSSIFGRAGETVRNFLSIRTEPEVLYRLYCQVLFSDHVLQSSYVSFAICSALRTLLIRRAPTLWAIAGPERAEQTTRIVLLCIQLRSWRV